VVGLLVQKFGGTSLATPDHVRHVARRVLAARREGYDLVVVVSAMGDTTDRLEELAGTITSRPVSAEHDALLATGEQVSAALLALALAAQDCPARSFAGWQAGIHTDSIHGKAWIERIDEAPLRTAIASGLVPVVAGFQGCSSTGLVTTLGRGGSDTTAVALATVLDADECHIYTDVDGVYTADPRIVKEARILRNITTEEMLELASLGSRVLHPRSVKFAGHYKVTLRVKSSLTEDPGTLILCNEEDSDMERPVVSGVTVDPDQAKITVQGVRDVPGVASGILGPIAARNINIDMIVQNVSEDGRTDFTFTVQRVDYDEALSIVQSLATKIGASRVKGDDCIAKISAVGMGMRAHAGVSSKAFKALAEENINIQMISTSESKISVVVDEKYMELAQRAMHRALCCEEF